KRHASTPSHRCIASTRFRQLSLLFRPADSSYRSIVAAKHGRIVDTAGAGVPAARVSIMWDVMRRDVGGGRAACVLQKSVTTDATGAFTAENSASELSDWIKGIDSSTQDVATTLTWRLAAYKNGFIENLDAASVGKARHVSRVRFGFELGDIVR